MSTNEQQALREVDLEIDRVNNQKTSYIKMADGGFYTLTKVSTPIKSIEDELKEHFTRKMESIKTKIDTSIAKDAMADLLAQTNHLDKVRDKRRSSMTVPQELFGVPCIVWLKEVMPIRIINYTYNRIQGYSYVLQEENVLTNEVAERCKVKSKLNFAIEPVVEGRRVPTQKVMLDVKCKWSTPIMIAYGARNKQLYTPTFIHAHTVNTSDQACCLDNNGADKIWALSDAEFYDYFTTINTLSLGNRSPWNAMNGRALNFWEFVRSNCEVTKVTIREEAKWTVRPTTV